MLTASLLLTACATTLSSAPVPPAPALVLPPLVSYSAAEQDEAFKELSAIKDKAPMVAKMMDDYGNLRAGIRAAGGR